MILACVLPSAAYAQRKKKKKEKAKKEQVKLDPPPPSSPSDTLAAEAALIEALKYYFKGEHKRAIPALEKALEKDGKNATAWFYLAHSFTAEDKMPEAQDAAREAHSLQPENTYFLEYWAETAEKNRDFNTAKEAWQKRLAQKASRQAYNKAYQFFARTRNYEAALQTLEKQEETLGLGEVLLRQRLWLLRREGKFDLALKVAEKLQAMYPKPESTFQYAVLLEQLGKKEEAHATYEKLCQQSTPYTPALEKVIVHMQKNLALADPKRYRNYMEAYLADSRLTALQKTSKLQTLYRLVQQQNDRTYGQMGEVLARLSLNYHESAGSLYGVYGDFLYLNEKLDSAAWAYQKALASSPNDYRLWARTLNLLWQQERAQDLQKQAEEASELYPNSVLPWFFMAEAQRLLGDVDEAVGSISQAEMLFAPNVQLGSDFTATHLQWGLARCYAAAGEKSRAKAAFEKALASPHSDPRFMERLHVEQAQLLHAETPDALLEVLQRKNPESPHVQFGLATAHIALGNYAQAQPLLEKACAKQALPTYLEALGDLYFKLGQNEKAVQAWEKANTLGGASPKLLQKIKKKQL